MKQVSGYILKTIQGATYILPYGQNLVDFKRSVKLNEAGVFLWKALETDLTRQELLDRFMEHYKARPENREMMEQDMNIFLQQMQSLGIIYDPEETDHTVRTPNEPLHAVLRIADLYIALYGNEKYFFKEFQPFKSEIHENQEPHIKIAVHSYPYFQRENGELLIQNNELDVIRAESGYILHFPTMDQVNRVTMTLDGEMVHIYCTGDITDELAEKVFHVIRFVYLYRAQKEGIFAIHSASFLYAGKAWLFSGHSGMGKSTHTNLWHRHTGVPLLNGDLNLLAIRDGKPVVYGLPWCGTSGISTVNNYPLGGIVLLQQAPEDRMEELSPDEQALLIMQRFISPMWIPKQAESCIRFAEELSELIYVARLYCTKELSAVECCKDAIDQYLRGSEQ